MEPQSHILALGVDFEEMALRGMFEFKTLKSEKHHYTIACKTEGCLWYLHATCVEETSIFHIRGFVDEHSCHGIGHLTKHFMNILLNLMSRAAAVVNGNRVVFHVA